MRHVGSCAHSSPALLPNVRVISPQPFAPRGKGRFARVRAARQSPDWLRARPLRAPALSASVRRLAGAESRAVGAGAFGRSGGVRACRRAARPAWCAPRIRRMRAIPPRRNTAFAAWPRPGGADGRPAVREALGRASVPVTSSALLALACLFFTMQPRDGCIYPAVQPNGYTNILRLDMRLSVERRSGPCARTG